MRMTVGAPGTVQNVQDVAAWTHQTCGAGAGTACAQTPRCLRHPTRCACMVHASMGQANEHFSYMYRYLHGVSGTAAQTCRAFPQTLTGASGTPGVVAGMRSQAHNLRILLFAVMHAWRATVVCMVGLGSVPRVASPTSTATVTTSAQPVQQPWASHGQFAAVY